MFTFMLLLVILLIAVVVIFYNKRLYMRFVKGESMLPTFTAGEVFFINSKYILQIGSVYVFHQPHTGELVMKRLHKIVNGDLYFVGDNADASYDSRNYGYVSTKAVIGEAVKLKELFGLWQK